LIGIVEPNVARVRVLRVRLAAPRDWFAGRRIEGQVVDSPVGREHEIGRQVAILGLHDDERRAPIGSGSSRGDFPPREIPSDATQNDFSGLELYDAGAEPGAGDGRLGMPIWKRDEAALPDDTRDPGREKEIGRAS